MKAVVFAAVLCLLPLGLAAQDEEPAATARAPRIGTTVLGERESPIGLYITPWRRAAPEAGIDRPARLLDQPLEPIDREVYRRQVEYNEKLTQARAAEADTDSPAP